MKKHKTSTLIAAGALLVSMLACNIGSSQSPSGSPAGASPAGNTSNSSGACANPFLPVISGAAWNYKLTGVVTDTFTRSILSIGAGAFTDQDVFASGATRQGQWNCDNGNLVALNPDTGSSATVTTSHVTADFQTTQVSGVTIPATINAGNSWTQNTTLEGTENINGTDIPARNEFSSTCNASGSESVSVEAGTFTAMKIDCQTVMNITITMPSGPIQTPLTLNGTNWYAENTGLVKSTITGQGFDSTIELVSYNIP